MNKDELSLLLYLESCSVDQGGLIDSRRMNKDDFDIAERWKKDRFIRFGRICFKDIQRLNHGQLSITHWVNLSKTALKKAHEERRARSIRMWSKRTWKTTSEKQQRTAGNGCG